MSEKTMEYADTLPKPVQTDTKLIDKDTTLFVTVTGEFVYLPTEEQSKAKVLKLMKKFKPEQWWAQKISRYRVGKKDFLCGYIKRDFSKDHNRSDFSNTTEHEMWLGRMEIGIPKMMTDTREHSESMGDRVAATIQSQMPDGSVQNVPVLEKRGYHSYHEATPANVKIYKRMSEMDTVDGNTTAFVFVLLNGGRNVGVDDPLEFWDMDTQGALDMDRKKKRLKFEHESERPAQPRNLKA